MIYIEDTEYRTEGKKTRRRRMYAIFKCNNCKNTTEGRKTQQLKNKDALCRECTSLLHGNKIKKHGDSQNNKLYAMYKNMKARCSNKNLPKYHRYGGRGISVCEEWMKYENFRKWAFKNGYKELTNVARGDLMSIDRVDVDGNYNPSNCQFIKQRINSVKDHTKFTNVDAIAINCIKEYFNFSNKKVGELFGCGQTLIWRVINNKAILKS